MPMTGKERILQTAMLLFARNPFSETSLRDIASAAQVDVAYVHRAYGSKAEIFRQALHALTPLDRVFLDASDGAEVIRRISKIAFQRDPQKPEDVQPLHLLMQSCVCSEARDIIVDFIETEIATPLAQAFGQTARGNALFAISLLSGFVTHRAVLAHAELLAGPEDRQRQLLEHVLQSVMLFQDD